MTEEQNKFAKLPDRVQPEDMTTSQAEPPPPASPLGENEQEWQEIRTFGNG